MQELQCVDSCGIRLAISAVCIASVAPYRAISRIGAQPDPARWAAKRSGRESRIANSLLSQQWIHGTRRERRDRPRARRSIASSQATNAPLDTAVSRTNGPHAALGEKCAGSIEPFARDLTLKTRCFPKHRPRSPVPPDTPRTGAPLLVIGGVHVAFSRACRG